MALRARASSSGVRERYTEVVREFAERYGRIEGCSFPVVLAQLEAGAPVVVQGWQINTRPLYDDFCIEPDGTVTPVEAVFVDTDAPVRSVVNYRRPDGSLVRNNPDARAVSAFGAGSGTALVTTTTDPAHL